MQVDGFYQDNSKWHEGMSCGLGQGTKQFEDNMEEPSILEGDIQSQIFIDYPMALMHFFLETHGSTTKTISSVCLKRVLVCMSSLSFFMHNDILSSRMLN